jgi:hypothetical protein
MLIKNENNQIVAEGMTIKELYEWAVENGVENAVLGVSLEDEAEFGYYEYCEEVRNEDLRIGGFYDNGKCVHSAVWIKNH